MSRTSGAACSSMITGVHMRSCVLYVFYMRYIIPFVLLAFVGACASLSHSHVTFRGNVVHGAALPFVAVRAYPGDIEALVLAGGRRLGTASVYGDTYADALAMLSHKAACRGASHFVVVYVEHLVPDGYHDEVGYNVEAALYRVPSAALGDLHPALRPTKVLDAFWCHR